MLSSLASYIWGASDEAADAPEAAETLHRSPSPDKLKTSSAENEWVLVDTASREGSPERCSRVPAPHGEHDPSMEEDEPSMEDTSMDFTLPLTPPNHPCQDCVGGRRRPSPPDIMHSSQSDTCSDVSTLPDGAQESWLVTPPPCFTAGSLSALETSSMENLLIEHPSMSVYQARGRQNSEGADSRHSDSEPEDVAMPPVAARGHNVSVRHPPRRPRAVAQRAGLIAPHKRVVQLKSRPITRAAMHRQNMVREVRGKQHRHSSRIVQPVSRGMRC